MTYLDYETEPYGSSSDVKEIWVKDENGRIKKVQINQSTSATLNQ